MIQFFADRGIQATVTPDGRLNLKGLSGLCDETRQEVLTFARENKAAILSELQPPPPDLSKIQPGHNIETGFKPGIPSQVKKIPGIPADYIQSPAVWMPGSTPTDQHRDTCTACGKNQWWRLNKPDSKRICARCHPPATGLDVISERI